MLPGWGREAVTNRVPTVLVMVMASWVSSCGTMQGITDFKCVQLVGYQLSLTSVCVRLVISQSELLNTTLPAAHVSGRWEFLSEGLDSATNGADLGSGCSGGGLPQGRAPPAP